MDLAHPSLPRDEVVAVATGTAFVVIGVLAGAVAAVRRRGGVRVFAWLGVWSAFYGLQELAATPSVVAALPGGIQAAAPWVRVTISYLLVVAATLAWRELSLGRLRLLLERDRRRRPPDRAGRDRRVPRDGRHRRVPARQRPARRPRAAHPGDRGRPAGEAGAPVHRAAAPWRVGRRHSHVRDRGAVHQPGPLVRLPLVPPARLARLRGAPVQLRLRRPADGRRPRAAPALDRERAGRRAPPAAVHPAPGDARPARAPAWPPCTSP